MAAAPSISLGLREKQHACLRRSRAGRNSALLIALKLVNDPEVVFLDELTTGLDPQARRTIWELVRGIRARGKTVFLTTHLMEEAERLCDRVAIIDRGRLVDLGTPADLVRRHCPTATVVIVTEAPGAAAAFAAIPGVTSVAQDGDTHTIRGAAGGLVTEVIRCLAARRIDVRDVRTELPTLEDVFLETTGRAMRD
jgi:ABC-2 type transport system ATP-binding protein